MRWPTVLNKNIKTRVNLAKYTSFKIGGRAKFFFEPKNIPSLQKALLYAKAAKLKVFILGAGSNILISDSGVNGLVIKLSNQNFKFFFNKGACITAGSGLKLNQLIRFAQSKGLSGLEFLVGIPGTLGGALAGNAGAWGKSIGQLVKEVTVLDYHGKLKKLSADKLKFAYRKSNLGKYIIFSAKFKLSAANKDEIAFWLKDYILKRKKNQNNRQPNAGCIFKNPNKNSAGFLIDACGLKGKAKGQALVSGRHANFILNSGKAKSSDVLALMKLIQVNVKKRFNVVLEPEIKIWK
jgi:UDP-N-acetylmuramate dehydrogenase